MPIVITVFTFSQFNSNLSLFIWSAKFISLLNSIMNKVEGIVRCSSNKEDVRLKVFIVFIHYDKVFVKNLVWSSSVSLVFALTIGE